MRPRIRAVLPLLSTIGIALPSAYLCLYLIESIYGVPLRPESFRFQRPWAGLLVSGAVLVYVARAWLTARAAPRLRVSRGRDLSRAGTGKRPYLRHGLTGMRVTAVLLMALALMGPQSIHARDRAELEGIDIVLVLDLSLSMQASDIRPSRFEATKAVVHEFIARRPSDRIGAVVFGRDAYTLLPLTVDKDALHAVIGELQLNLIDGRGTAIGNAVGTALNRLRESETKSKVVILLTDGDSNAGNVSPDQAAEFASTMGVKVFTILMGQSEQAPVQRGQDIFGRALWDRGSFPINPELLKGMSTRTGGEYFQVTDREGLEQSFHAILDRLDKSEIEDAGRVYGELFPAFLWPAFWLLVLELTLGSLVLRRWP